LRQPPPSAIPVEYLTPSIEDRAVATRAMLADRGQHRVPSIPDLIIAAAAALAGLTVLYLEKDFDLVADVTGAVRRAPPPGLTARRNHAIPAQASSAWPQDSGPD